MIMKKEKLIKYGILAITALLILEGCNDSDLDIPVAKQTSESFFSENGPASYNQAVIGGYAKLTQFYKNYTGVNGTPPSYLHAIGLMRDDLLTSNQPDPYEVFGSLNATDPSNTVNYKLSYELIARMNLTLANMAEFGDKVFVDNSELKNIYEGEARFLRAYAYFHLAVNYSTPPMVTEPIQTLSYIPVNSQADEVLDFALSELNAVTALLPNNWDGENIGRATKGSAYGILGKALLHRASTNGYNAADLTAAISAFNQIEGLGYSLAPNFGENFDGTMENNAESLFEIQVGQNSVQNNIWVPIDDFDVIGDLGGYWGFFDAFLTSRLMLPSTKLQTMFEDGDPRKDMTFREGQIKKYIDGNVRQFPTSHNNARVLRYADVLLMKAEAMLMSGGDKQEVIQLMNMVRERARNSGETPSVVPADRDMTEADEDTIFQWIMEERVYELAAEESWRWYDLIRWHKAGKIDLAGWDFSSDQTGISFELGKNLLLPFPSSEVSISNGGLVQNPNY